MANNPVQVVLNSSNFVVRPEQQPHPMNCKDFYAGRDQQFIAHKNALLGEIQHIRAELQRSPEMGLEYAHVVLQGDAWAKTNRPTSQVLPPHKVPLVGGGKLGEMLVELTTENIGVVERAIELAEETVAIKDDPIKGPIAKPSKQRSEVGAIETIRLHQPTDRRTFSAEDAASWLKDPRTGGFYVVETFADLTQFSRENHGRPRAHKILLKFFELLAQSNLPVDRIDAPPKLQGHRLLFFRVRRNPNETDTERLSKHQAVLQWFESQPAVRRILLPPIIDAVHAVASAAGAPQKIATPQANASYAVVGIVDTGISAVSGLEPWCAGRSDVVGTALQDRAHGTFIGGITSAADQFNSHALYGEQPCKFYDLALYPTPAGSFENFFRNGFLDFLDQLDAEIAAAKATSSVRIFNMSLALEREVSDDSYGPFAEMVDAISDGHNVLFVLPSGNILPPHYRNEWPDNASAALKMLAEYRHTGKDRIFQPAESIRSVVTAALNPPSCTSAALRPATYSRRGPSVALGAKPDVAHIGGRGQKTHELLSVTVNGQSIEGCGTSYAAPFIAKILANLDHQIEGDVERETLIGLLIHHSHIPADLAKKELSRVARDFVGFGLPLHCGQMLETGDHSITLVFNAKLEQGQELVFPFSWPASLVTKDGKCRGRVRLTLAYRPTIDASFDSEFVRTNLDAYLRQEKIDHKTGEVLGWAGRLSDESDKRYERQLIEHGQKWSPVKQYESAFLRKGSSSQWRLVVDGMTRAGTHFPPDGIPFCVVLTIEDPSTKENVFREMRQGLQTAGAKIADVRTANRIRANI